MSGCGERFVCDEMLARLGRWLRAAGYDVVIAAAGEEDRAILQRAMAEQRHLLTRDRKLLEYRGAASVVTLLRANQLPGQLEELSDRFAIDWLCQPFSRCLECNSLLVPASETIRSRVPREALQQDGRVLYCPSCDQPYWHGSHVKRMRLKLEHFSSGNWDVNVEEELATHRGGE